MSLPPRRASGPPGILPRMSEGTHLLARGFGYAFPSGLEALREVNLQVRAGEFLAIVGPSGCGKSTWLRLVAGLLRGGRGELRVHGEDPLPARRRGNDLAFVFQAPTLLPWRTVEGNVRLPLELRGSLDAQGRARASELLSLVGLDEFRDAYPHTLSGGMRMRVSLARALVTRPRLLLLDEPFAALDDITRQRLNEELLGLWQRDRVTALFVTHNVGEAVFLAERVAVMSPRPGTILHEIEVPFRHPRTPALRAEAEFARLVGEIGGLLRAGTREAPR
jgi:NitT/TauT family transport system ATP-binding protein